MFPQRLRGAGAFTSLRFVRPPAYFLGVVPAHYRSRPLTALAAGRFRKIGRDSAPAPRPREPTPPGLLSLQVDRSTWHASPDRSACRARCGQPWRAGKVAPTHFFVSCFVCVLRRRTARVRRIVAGRSLMPCKGCSPLDVGNGCSRVRSATGPSIPNAVIAGRPARHP